MALAPGAPATGGAARAADQLELRLETLTIPIPLDQLEALSRGERLPAESRAEELRVWMSLLRPESQRDLLALLRAPLLRDRSFGRQLLDSWAGSQMLAELGGLLTTPDGQSTTPLLQSTLMRLLGEGREVTAIDLLRGLPPPRLTLQLDGLVALAERWREQRLEQQRALEALRRLALESRTTAPLAFDQGEGRVFRRLSLAVSHRREGLPLEIWPARPSSLRVPPSQPWLLLMPGLGGTAEQWRWLAGALADRGWPVVVLQHPGSDAAAIKASLAGQSPPPGAETLPARLADVKAVLAAQQQGRLGVDGEGVVLVGHSLGAVTALLAAGLPPVPGLENRCRQALERLPINNPSRLLQCQMVSTGLPSPSPRLANLRGVVVLNGFGSLLWAGQGLAPLAVPVLMAGGSLDLVTPPVEELLGVFLPSGDPRSRLVLVEGGSHFSPVRVAATEEALFRLGDDLVGEDPQSVQRLLLRLTSEFLETLEQPLVLLAPQRRQQEGVTAYVLDPAHAQRLRAMVRP